MRLIDADELKADYHMADDCKDCKTNVRDCEYDHVYTKMDFCSWLDDAPTVDAVPVVRCKDCRYYERNNHKCEVFRAIVCDNFYCKDGERKDGDGNGRKDND